MTAPPAATGMQARPTRPPGRQWWPGTLWVLVGTPLVLTGCGWLAQRPGFPWMLLATVVVLTVLVTSWAMCGAKAGTGVAVFGFTFLLFVGPALGDYVMQDRGVPHDALSVDVSTYRGRSGRERPVCTFVLTGADRGRTVEVGDTGGCDDDLTTGSHVTIVADPEGWLAPRLGGEVNGVAPYLLWTVAGLLTALDACALYGRLRRRRRNV